MKLHSHWRSSASYRVRIALNLKGVDHEIVPVDLARGVQRGPDFALVNPARAVPVLELADGTRLTQSLAIIGWLDAVWPRPPLLPADPAARARITSLAHHVAMDIHPLNTPRVLAHLGERFGAGDTARRRWMRHWMSEGFTALSRLLPTNCRFAAGDAPTLADTCIVPQLYNARRWGMEPREWPRLAEVEDACMELGAFRAARPEAQPDANRRRTK